jgi:hypothetical protein
VVTKHLKEIRHIRQGPIAAGWADVGSPPKRTATGGFPLPYHSAPAAVLVSEPSLQTKRCHAKHVSKSSLPGEGRQVPSRLAQSRFLAWAQPHVGQHRQAGLEVNTPFTPRDKQLRYYFVLRKLRDDSVQRKLGKYIHTIKHTTAL